MNSSEINEIVKELGEPKRYAYKARPVLLYKTSTSGFMKSEFIAVTFEMACDLLSTDWIDVGLGTPDPFVVSDAEPGINPNKQIGLIIHDVILTYDCFCKLRELTNSNGNLHRYSGVIEGYDVEDIARFVDGLEHRKGLWLTPEAFDAGFVRYPMIPFDEQKHTRFVQASYSYAVKKEKRLQNYRKM